MLLYHAHGCAVKAKGNAKPLPNSLGNMLPISQSAMTAARYYWGLNPSNNTAWFLWMAEWHPGSVTPVLRYQTSRMQCRWETWLQTLFKERRRVRGCSQHLRYSRCQHASIQVPACLLVGEGLSKASCPSWHKSGSIVGTPSHIFSRAPKSAPILHFRETLSWWPWPVTSSPAVTGPKRPAPPTCNLHPEKQETCQQQKRTDGQLCCSLAPEAPRCRSHMLCPGLMERLCGLTRCKLTCLHSPDLSPSVELSHTPSCSYNLWLITLRKTQFGFKYSI